MTEGLTEAVKVAAPENEATGEWEFIGAPGGLDLGIYSGQALDELATYLAGLPNQVTTPQNTSSPQTGLPRRTGGASR